MDFLNMNRIFASSMKTIRFSSILKCIRLLPLAFVFMAGLTGCFTSFEPDIDSKPVLCMNSLITDGDSIKVSLTRTWRWSEGVVVEGYDQAPIDLVVYDGVIKLFVDNEYKETLKLVETEGDYPYRKKKWVYVAEYIPKSGDTIRLEALSEEYGEASAEVEVPYAVPIENVDYTVKDFVMDGDESSMEDLTYYFDMDLLVWFSDPGCTTDYYMFKTSTSGHKSGEGDDGSSFSEYIYYSDVSDDPLFSEHVSALESAVGIYSGYTFFSDRQISGKKYSLHVDLDDICYYLRNPSGHPDVGNAEFYMDFYTISPSYYKHVISVWQSNDGIVGSLGGVGLADPVFESSNVSTGAGVVAAAVSKYAIPFADIREKAENN